MRIALLYPPPWKIPAAGSSDYYGQDGAPRDYVAGDLDGDFFQIPYGLLCLGAEALRAGHSVKVLNLSSFDWPTVERLVANLDADLFGLSCWTANRRGVGSVARAIRLHHPSAHIVVGGPHATALPLEMLAHHPAIDAIAVGESERTFVELAARVEQNEPCVGVAGTAYRSGGRPVFAQARARIRDLDSLASPHDVYDTHVIMTSRGCAWRCTFCGAEASWGRGYRSHSTPYVVDALARMESRLPLRMVHVKDDTFTTDKKRVIALCRAIRDRGIKLRWSCDTRVDVLSDELLQEMRLAGCERLSFGVESGSQRILDAVDKKITLEQIEKSTELAKKWGLVVRHYMMIGNRGETRESFAESLRFLERVRPHQYIFGCLAVYPGTRDFREAAARGWLRAASYFDGDFQELKTTFDASPTDTAVMADWFQKNKGLTVAYRPGVQELAAILERLPDHASAHVDLGAALLVEKRFAEAKARFARALELGYPTPGVIHNYRAAMAATEGDVEAMKQELLLASQNDPLHPCVMSNVATVRAWLARGATEPLPALAVGHEFQVFERTLQPTLPGPLGSETLEWSREPAGPGSHPGGGTAPTGPPR